MNRLDIAIEFAAKAHQNQKRKGTDIPYISHPFGVAMILHNAKCRANQKTASGPCCWRIKMTFELNGNKIDLGFFF